MGFNLPLQFLSLPVQQMFGFQRAPNLGDDATLRFCSMLVDEINISNHL